MYVNKMDSYEEAQHIREVLERGNPLKGISREGGVIQVEQESRADLEIVLEELGRDYDIKSIQKIAGGWAVGISRKRIRGKDEGR